MTRILLALAGVILLAVTALAAVWLLGQLLTGLGLFIVGAAGVLGRLLWFLLVTGVLAATVYFVASAWRPSVRAPVRPFTAQSTPRQPAPKPSAPTRPAPGNTKRSRAAKQADPVPVTPAPVEIPAEVPIEVRREVPGVAADPDAGAVPVRAESASVQDGAGDAEPAASGPVRSGS